MYVNIRWSSMKNIVYLVWMSFANMSSWRSNAIYSAALPWLIDVDKRGYFVLGHHFPNVFQGTLSTKDVALKRDYMYFCVYVCVCVFVWSTCLGNNVYKFGRREAVKVNLHISGENKSNYTIIKMLVNSTNMTKSRKQT